MVVVVVGSLVGVGYPEQNQWCSIKDYYFIQYHILTYVQWDVYGAYLRYMMQCVSLLVWPFSGFRI